MNAHKLFLALLAGLSPALLAAPEWPQFRGPNSSGVAEGARPPQKFGPAESVVWEVPVPSSPSSPVVSGNQLFLTTFENGQLQVRSYQRTDGKLLWNQPLPAKQLEEFHQTEGSPAASTPATDGQRVVSYFGSLGLVAHDFLGRELWRVPMPVAVTSGNFGSGTSPLIHDNKVFLNRDQTTGSALFAFDAATGRKLWETPRAEAPTSYGSPIVWSQGAVTDLVVAGSLLMKGYDPSTGAERWMVSGLPSFTCTTPVLGEGSLFFAGWSPGKADSPWPSWASTAEKQDKNGDGWISLDEFADGAVWFKAQDLDGDGKLTKKDWDEIGGLMKKGENVLLSVKQGGTGDVTESNVAWRFTRGLPYVPSPLYYQGRVYIIKDGGMVSSVDPKTGQPAYVQERINAQGGYYASPVAADGRIFVASLQGMVTVFKAGGEKPEILHQVNFGERIAATMALVGDTIYLRTATKLFAFSEKAKPLALNPSAD